MVQPLNFTVSMMSHSMLKSSVSAEMSAEEQARYIVHLPVFEGPLALLLHLIEKRQMEITTISLVAVTDQYLEHLHNWEEREDRALPPLADMAAFVSIASRLLYIKSQSLLPHFSQAQDGAEFENAVTMAEELQRHLLEYKLAKDIARVLHLREEAGLQTHSRSGLLAGIEAQLSWTPPTLVGMDVQMLANAFEHLLELQTRGEVAGDGLLPVARVLVSERVSVIRHHLSRITRVVLTDMLQGETSRLVIIVTFIAVLELWKWQRIDVQQDNPMDMIILSRGANWTDNEWPEIINDEA
jgi:segregation and condensation protein A